MTYEQLTLFDDDGTPWHQRPEYQHSVKNPTNVNTPLPVDKYGNPIRQVSPKIKKEAESIPTYETAFLVYLDENSEFVVTNDLTAFNVRRSAKPRDILRGLSECLQAFAQKFYNPPATVDENEVADRIRKAMQQRG